MSAVTTTEQKVEQLTKKIAGELKNVDSVINHFATQIGALETQTKSTSDVLEQLSKDFIESHDGLGSRMDSIVIAFDGLRERINNTETPTPSVPVELYKALVGAQSEIKNAEKGTDNEFTGKKYADLASVMNAVREPLANNGLAIIQVTATIEEVAIIDANPAAIGIKTTLFHETGESIVDTTAMVPEKFSPQGIGSCRTYMRRYAVLAICAIAGADDDDAEGATKGPNEYERIEDAEVEKIIYHADELFEEHSDAAVTLMLQRIFSYAKCVGDIKAGGLEIALNYLDNTKKARDKQIALAKKKEKAEAKAAKEEK